MEQTDIEGFKTDVHRILISKLDLEKLSRVNSGQARQAVARHDQRDHPRPESAAEL